MPSIETCPLCTKQDDKRTNWLQCDICAQWFHAECLHLSPAEINTLHSYHCKMCSTKHGTSIYKRQSKRTKVQIDYVALNEGSVFAVDKSRHPHVPLFMSFPTEPDVLESDTLDMQLALTTRLAKPILVPQANLKVVGMTMPRPKDEITIDFITEAVGEDTSVEVMDVLSQQGVQPGWNMQQWRDYFRTEKASRDRIRNVISLEVSQAKQFGMQFHRPQLVRDMDLVDKVWDPDDEQERSQVTKYCLMSVSDSFTDFHIDFGGTSVYYTVCSGSKTFLMFPPTDSNLDLYTSWCLEPEQNFIWFADYSKTQKGRHVQPSGGFKVTLVAGDLFIIPSGWIHAVYTPQDSIVIGGNFLTLLDMKMQLRINSIEKTTKVPGKFRFPLFNKVLWLTSLYYLDHSKEYITDSGGGTIAEETARLLIAHLEAHYELSKTNSTAKRSIPAAVSRNVSAHFARMKHWLSQLQATSVKHDYDNDNPAQHEPQPQPVKLEQT